MHLIMHSFDDYDIGIILLYFILLLVQGVQSCLDCLCQRFEVCLSDCLIEVTCLCNHWLCYELLIKKGSFSQSEEYEEVESSKDPL